MTPPEGKDLRASNEKFKKSATQSLQKKNFKEWVHYIFKEWVLTLGLALVIALAFRSTIAAPRHIPTGSMIPTIKVGEFIFVNMMYYNWHIPFTGRIWSERRQPGRGDILVFEYPFDKDKDYIKRVIAIPGDVVEIRNKRVILNGEPLPLEEETDRSLLNDLAPNYNPENITLFRETNGESTYHVMHIHTRRASNMEARVVPADSYFVMGDNRDDSEDSRFWGFVPRDKVLGTGSFIWLSVNTQQFPFLRFSRFFTGLR